MIRVVLPRLRVPLIVAVVVEAPPVIPPLNVSVPPPVMMMLPPFIASAPIVCEKPLRSYVPALMVVVPLAVVFATPYFKVPALIVVVPEYRLLAFKVSVPAPFLTMEVAPV